MKWIKASERLPEKDHNYHVRATTKHQGYNHNDTAWWHNGTWQFQHGRAGYSVVEWLDEQAPDTSEGWISVKDGLPEDGETVLINMSKFGKGTPYGYYLGFHHAGEWIIQVDGKDQNAEPNPDYWKVTHWQPLPKPPIQ